MAYEDYLLANHAANLRGYWKLGADASDSSGNNRHGTVLNTAPTYGQTGIPGSAASAALFGASRGLRFEANPSAGGSSPFAAGAFTLVAWIKRLGAGVTITSGTGGHTAIEPILGKGMAQSEGGDLDANYLLGLVNSTGMKVAADFEEDDPGSGAYGLNHPVTGTATVTDSAWHMVAAVYNWNGTTGSWLLYLDGVNCGSLAVNEPPESQSLAAFVVGCGLRTTDADTAPQGSFNGHICHVAMWASALLPADIANLNAAGNPSTPAAALVTASTTLPTPTIVIQLSDASSGIQDSSVTAADVVLKRNGARLYQGVDYAFAYDPATDRITLTRLPVGAYFNSGSYQVVLNPV
jgi:hypothetical protein